MSDKRIILIPPPPETRVFRLAAEGKSPPGIWHILASNRDQKAICGRTYFLSRGMRLEYSTLGEISNKLCPSCWPWGMEVRHVER